MVNEKGMEMEDVGPGEVISFASGQPNAALIPSEDIADASVLCARNTLAPAPYSLQYGRKEGPKCFTISLARFLEDVFGCPVDEENVGLSAGTSHALAVITSRLRYLHEAKYPGSEANRDVICELPTYFHAEKIFRDSACRLVPWPRSLISAETSIDLLEIILEDRKARGMPPPVLIYTIPVHHNPCGTCFTDQQMERINDLAEKFDTTICADEPYNLLGFDAQRPHFAMMNNSWKNVVSMGSFSKLLAPGLRCGYVVGHEETLHKAYFDSGPVASGGGVNPFSAYTVSTMMESGKLMEIVNGTTRPVLAQRMNLLNSELKKYDIELDAIPKGGYFGWLTLNFETSSPEFVKACQGENLALLAGSRCVCHFDGPYPEGHKTFMDALQRVQMEAKHSVRMSVSFVNEKQIVEGAKRLHRVLKLFK